MGPMSEDDFQAEQDMHILQEAERVAKDPTRMARAREVAKAKAEELNRFAKKTAPSADAEMTARGYRKL